MLLSSWTSKTELLRREIHIQCTQGYSLVVQKEVKEVSVLEGFVLGHSALQVWGNNCLKHNTAPWDLPTVLTKRSLSAHGICFPDLCQQSFSTTETQFTTPTNFSSVHLVKTNYKQDRIIHPFTPCFLVSGNKRLGNNGLSCCHAQADNNCLGLKDFRADLTGSQLKTTSSLMPLASFIYHFLLQ